MAPSKKIQRSILCMLFAACFALTAQAEEVSFPGAHAPGFFYTESVKGNFVLPAKRIGKVPAVLILHGSAGVDGRGAMHANTLNRAGFATMEIVMFSANQRPKEGHETTLTHAYGALKYLASRPEIDKEKIAAIGFSWGANMAVKMASDYIGQQFQPDTPNAHFSALAAFYPVCWTHSASSQSSDPNRAIKYAAFTTPLLILAGGLDDYGTPDECQKFVASLPENAKKWVELEFYPSATHGWDGEPSKNRTVYDPVAFQGQGGKVRMYADTQIAAASRDRLLQFLKKTLAIAD